MMEKSWRRLGFASCALFFVLTPFACTDAHINTATTASSSSGASTGSAASGSGGESSASTSHTSSASGSATSSVAASMCAPDDPACHPVLTCGVGHVYQCGNGVDDDGDSKIDMDDPDCTGPCDDSEDSLYSNNPGQPSACKVGCYFGTPGNHECYWDHTCDPNETPANNYAPESNHGSACGYNPAKIVNPPGKTCAELMASQPASCLDYCKPITPNGCDCFGCCELPAGSNRFVWLGSTNALGQHCTMDTLADPSVCQPCTVVPSCYNPCDTCKVCIGKPAPDPGCNQAAQCDPGVQACGQPGESACPTGKFCKTGCCYPLPL